MANDRQPGALRVRPLPPSRKDGFCRYRVLDGLGVTAESVIGVGRAILAVDGRPLGLVLRGFHFRKRAFALCNLNVALPGQE